MTPDIDPYRTLGLARTATLDEVKRAYRKLAKANHPDAAGEAALPRFLAIQAAYDLIAGNGAAGTDSRRSSQPRRPWEADPARSDATRRAYGGRGRRGRATDPSGAPRQQRPPQGSAGTSGAGAAGAANGATSGSGETGPASGEGGTERQTNKATFGSTSYDGADAEPFEPDWGGASWYGTTSGTYWTLNPKEYADPRKHGPEYQARARRRMQDASEAPPVGPPGDADASAAAPPEAPSDPSSDASATGSPTGAQTTGTPPPAGRSRVPPIHTTASWWESTAGGTAAEGAPETTGRATAADPAPARAGDFAPSTPYPRGPQPDDLPELESMGATIRAWLEDDRPSVVGRVGRAVLGWAPLALGIGWLAGEISGCARFAASCDAAANPFAWLAQVLVLAVFLVVPRLARIAVIGTIAALVAAIPGTAILSATSGPAAIEAGRTALGGLLVLAWVAGIGVGVWRTVGELRTARERGEGDPPGTARPVS